MPVNSSLYIFTNLRIEGLNENLIIKRENASNIQSSIDNSQSKRSSIFNSPINRDFRFAPTDSSGLGWLAQFYAQNTVFQVQKYSIHPIDYFIVL
jgi:hypothetical protein